MRIGMFVVSNETQGNSYGREVMESLFEECKTAEWKSIGLAVYLKNWKGLRFWNKNGFNKIIGIYREKEYRENTFSVIGLKKEILYEMIDTPSNVNLVNLRLMRLP